MNVNLTELVSIDEETNQMTTTSMHVAWLFGVSHDEITDLIDRPYFSESFNDQNFLVHFIEIAGEENKPLHRFNDVYKLTSDGFEVVAMAFSDKALRYEKELFRKAFFPAMADSQNKFEEKAEEVGLEVHELKAELLKEASI